MQEESRVRTDDRGSFTLPVNLPGQPHVIRVVHDRVNYDYQWTKGLVPEIKVFNTAAKVAGLKGYATIVKLESDGQIYKITELYAITNESNPPRTQTAPHNLEIYPPQAAEIDSAMVAGPEGLPVKATPVLVGGEAGHYAIEFPLRPGMTRYVVHYHLPYSEKLVFHPRLNYPTRQLSIVFPKSMNFTPLGKGEFHSLIDQDGVRVQVINELHAGTAPGFVISGTGAIAQPRKTAATAKPVPERRSGADVHSAQPQSSKPLLWTLLSGIFAILGTGAYLLWRSRKAKRQAKETLKEKLFAIETAHLAGALSTEEYAATKDVLSQELEEVLTQQGEEIR